MSIDGANWSTPKIVGGATSSIKAPSLSVISGQPAIGYIDENTNDLIYIQSTDVDGVDWASPQVIDSEGTIYNNSLLAINGKAAISYFDGSYGDLKFVKQE